MIKSGIHFYININNYNDIILSEEGSTRRVTRSIHALNTFFTEIERYCNNHFQSSLVIEKITGSRIHLYVLSDGLSGYYVVKAVSEFAYELAKCINKDIYKYNKLKDFKIQVGCEKGHFYDFEFQLADGYVEYTSIGYVANFAAKIQALTEPSYFSISDDIYNSLDSSEKHLFVRKTHLSLRKYQQDHFYSTKLADLSAFSKIDVEADIKLAKEKANNINLSEVEFSSARKPIDFKNLSLSYCKDVLGIPVFADIRGFTTKFDKDDNNLEEMMNKTCNVLSAMYTVTTQNHGIHVQFQGDRELSLYHRISDLNSSELQNPESMCYKNAILSAMRMIDAVKPYNLNIGIGADFGRLFATKIGARGSKDNILLGETVINAERMEDVNAGADQIAITEAVYNGLLLEDPYLAKHFTNQGEYYLTTIGYGEYLKAIVYSEQNSNTHNNNYNGAWRSFYGT